MYKRLARMVHGLHITFGISTPSPEEERAAVIVWIVVIVLLLGVTVGGLGFLFLSGQPQTLNP